MIGTNLGNIDGWKEDLRNHLKNILVNIVSTKDTTVSDENKKIRELKTKYPFFKKEIKMKTSLGSDRGEFYNRGQHVSVHDVKPKNAKERVRQTQKQNSEENNQISDKQLKILLEEDIRKINLEQISDEGFDKLLVLYRTQIRRDNKISFAQDYLKSEQTKLERGTLKTMEEQWDIGLETLHCVRGTRWEISKETAKEIGEPFKSNKPPYRRFLRLLTFKKDKVGGLLDYSSILEQIGRIKKFINPKIKTKLQEFKQRNCTNLKNEDKNRKLVKKIKLSKGLNYVTRDTDIVDLFIYLTLIEKNDDEN